MRHKPRQHGIGVARIANDERFVFAPQVYCLETINELAEYVDSLKPRPKAPVAASDDETNASSPLDESTEDDGEPGDPMKHYAMMNRRINSLKERGLYFFEPEISEHNDAWVVADGQRMLMLGSY
ncbi:MAG: hypothetical protein ABI614_16870, partial [Planctomycetota bacterium]